MSKINNQLRPLFNKGIKNGLGKGPMLRDIITDVMHLATEQGVRFDAILESASEVYKEERLLQGF